MSVAAEQFQAGVAALGIIDGTQGDQHQALHYFSRASDLDPSMCDAWLGRILCGDTGVPTMYKAWRNRASMGAQVSRMGIHPSKLWAHFDLGMGILGLSQPIYDQSSLAAALARTLVMAETPDYSEAIDTLAEATPTAITEWVRAAIYYRAERWSEVIDTLASSARLFDKDPMLKIAADLAAGIAHSHLGEFDEAGPLLRAAQDGASRIVAPELQAVVGQALASAHWYLALIARERGEEERAQALLRQVAEEDPEAKVTAAITNPEIRLQVTTRDAVEQRSDPWDPATGPSAQDLQDERRSADREKLLAEATAALDAQIGMDELKDQVKTFRARTRMAEKRRELGLKTPAAANHMVFVGPPGTGKTTVANAIAKMLCGLGIVSKHKVVEVSAKNLIGQHLGDSEAKTLAAVEAAMDGVLFIDETYVLVSQDNVGSNADSFGKAVMDTLLAKLENERERFVVIIAGYEAEIDFLLATNEGISSRFAHRFRFNTYSPDELLAIAEAVAVGRDDLIDSDGAEDLRAVCQRLSVTSTADTGRSAIDVVGNGRFVRKVVEAGSSFRDRRLDEDLDPPEVLDEKYLMTIQRPDMRKALEKVLAGESVGAGLDLSTILPGD